MSRLQQEFQRIVDEHYATLWSYVGALTGGSPDGEDILHQAFEALQAASGSSCTEVKCMHGSDRNEELLPC